jgi:SAM-dependent methyltransferase
MKEVCPSPDYQRNCQEYDEFWSSRWRRHWTYSIQTKLRRFRHLMRLHGLLERDGLSVFDMGFGLGSMLFVFRPSCRLAGMELSVSAVQQAELIGRKRGQAVDFRAFIPGQPYPFEWQGAFDVVISSHVLEHIQDPVPALHSLLELLRPKGIACIVVPINEEPGDDLNHFHYFTENSFRLMLENEKLEILSIQSCDRLYRLMMPIARQRQRSSSKLARIGSLAMNAMLAPWPYGVLSVADKMLGVFGLRETQCYALARRNG